MTSFDSSGRAVCREEIIDSINDLASHMYALSFVFRVAAVIAEKALDDD